MTTLVEAREAVYQRFVDNYATSVFTFDNEKFNPPDAPWVRLTVRQTGGVQETLGSVGNRNYNRVASVFAQVFTLVDTGTKEGDDIAQEIRAIFEGRSFSGLRFFNGVVRETGPDGRFYQHVAEIVFDYEEKK